MLFLVVGQEKLYNQRRRQLDMLHQPVLPVGDDLPLTTRQRNSVINEIFQTELQFVNDLAMIIEHYVKPLRERRLLSDDELKKLFSEIERIYELHMAFLAALQDNLKHGGANIGRSFMQLLAGGLIALYSLYCVAQSTR